MSMRTTGAATAARELRRDRVVVRRARAGDVPQLAALVDDWATEERLLPRDAASIALAVDDYVVAVDPRGRVLACAAVREYAPSLAELVSVATVRAAHGRGLGRLVVAAAERLAAARGHASLFAHTCAPGFFAAIGYEPAERGAYPEKRTRPHTSCVRRALVAAAGEAAAVAA